MINKKIKLQPIAMVMPNKQGIYAPSRIQTEQTMSKKEFISDYADSARSINVSFESDGLSNPKPVTAYGKGLNCWFIKR